MIKISYDPGRLGWLVWEYQNVGRGREVKTADGTWKAVKEGEYVEPTMRIEDLQEWAIAIREAGVKLPSDHKLEGILEATKTHLEDMRSIVFNRLPETLSRPTGSGNDTEPMSPNLTNKEN